MSVQAWFNRIWYERPSPPAWLLPMSALYAGISALRRWGYQKGWRPRLRVGCPVIVVGNLSVGGTGKTPLVLWLSGRLSAAGYQPGIVTRGYTGTLSGVQRVAPTAEAAEVGDEALLLARRSGVPVARGADRPAAARLLVDAGCDVIVCDDGLQHYALERDCELVVIDAERGLGNGGLLPAGPLREGPQRLASVDAVIFNGGGTAGQALAAAALFPVALHMRLAAAEAVALQGGARRPLTAFSGGTVHAVAAIGNPRRFFGLLRGVGIRVIEHPLPDHAPLGSAQLCFADEFPVLMTEKDAVKCGGAIDRRHWAVPVEALFSDADEHVLLETVFKCVRARRRESPATTVLRRSDVDG